METVRYKGYVIEPRVSQLRDGGFGAEVYIEEHTGPSVNIKQFYFENTFTTEAEARDHALAAGRRIIDEGRV